MYKENMEHLVFSRTAALEALADIGKSLLSTQSLKDIFAVNCKPNRALNE